MNWAYRLALALHRKNLLRFFPWRFLKAYVYPMTVRGPKRPYEAARYFDSYYIAAGELSDRITIGPAVSGLHSRYHYNAVENSIIRGLLRCQVRERPTVFDLGPGAGHWIDFYRATFAASYVCGLDISKACADRLRAKYAATDGVAIVQGDVAEASFRPERRFDIVNAIGVVFHIVDDARWLQALVNMRALLQDDGVMVVGGEFGLITQNVQFHASDDFDTLEEMRKAPSGGEVRVNKRIRSLRQWKRAARAAGLRVKALIRTANAAEIVTPENNVLLLERERG
jgi:trans-aconitate methyltransferase